MGLISFFRDAGEKLLHKGSAKDDAQASAPAAAQPSQQAPAPATENVREKEQALERAILDYMAVQKLPVEKLTVLYESAKATVTVSGSVPDQQTREKVVLCCGNIQGVEHVDDRLTVEQASQESKWYTVKSGDTLSKIAKEFYGNANQYNVIFEANKPMLTDPNKIYPGQMLRIPDQA
jgi:nucleoid-associated protein YgaU